MKISLRKWQKRLLIGVAIVGASIAAPSYVPQLLALLQTQ